MLTQWKLLNTSKVSTLLTILTTFYNYFADYFLNTVKREENISQNTMLEEGEKNPTDEMSQMMIDGISIPENSTLINTKVTKDLNTRENNGSTLQ